MLLADEAEEVELAEVEEAESLALRKLVILLAVPEAELESPL